MATFTRQQKLALALTSAGSMRALAREMGVTHQKIGRWLREGEQLPPTPDGVLPTTKTGKLKRYGPIPDYIDDQLNWVFDRHKEITKQQAKVDGVPYNSVVPVYTERRYLSQGYSEWITSRKAVVTEVVKKYGPDWQRHHQIEYSEKLHAYRIRKVGDRVISGPTEFIRQDMRKKWVAGMVNSEAFFKVNVRSIIDLKSYFERVADDELESGRRRGISKRKLAKEIQAAFIRKERKERGRIVDATEPFPLYTSSLDARPGSGGASTAEGVEFLLDGKHATATGKPGTHFADEYLLQLLPDNYKRPARAVKAKKNGNNRSANARGGKKAR